MSAEGPTTLSLRVAAEADLPSLEAVMAAAIAELQRGFLSPAEIEASADIMGLDRQLVADGTYLVVEERGLPLGCGGWSRRATLYGGSHSAGRDARLLDPETEPARIRAMYTHPAHARRGIGRMILDGAEAAARAEGFARAELVATLAGEPLYAACGYGVIERVEVPTRSGVAIPVCRMAKSL